MSLTRADDKDKKPKAIFCSSFGRRKGIAYLEKKQSIGRASKPHSPPMGSSVCALMDTLEQPVPEGTGGCPVRIRAPSVCLQSFSERTQRFCSLTVGKLFLPISRNKRKPKVQLVHSPVLDVRGSYTACGVWTSSLPDN